MLVNMSLRAPCTQGRSKLIKIISFEGSRGCPPEVTIPLIGPLIERGSINRALLKECMSLADPLKASSNKGPHRFPTNTIDPLRFRQRERRGQGSWLQRQGQRQGQKGKGQEGKGKIFINLQTTYHGQAPCDHDRLDQVDFK